MTDIKVPALGEWVTEATVARWLKHPGDPVAVDDPLVELETDKVTLEVNASAAGTLGEIAVQEGATVNVGALLGTIADGAAPAAKPAQANGGTKPAAAAPAPKPAPAPAQAAAPAAPAKGTAEGLAKSGPAVRKIAEEKGIDPATVMPTGKDGRLTKGDVLAAAPAAQPFEQAAPPAAAKPAVQAPPAAPSGPRPRAEREQRVRMTRLRQRIAERLKEAQNTAAMLTTFNEVDMTALNACRNQYKDAFEK